MCIGLAMQVIEAGEFQALCQGLGEARMIDTRLVGRQTAGNWLLVFLDAAREELEPERALQIQAAVAGLHRIMHGEADVDRWFPDLAGREPQLPDFLKPAS
ncbi:HypC/HybG/HupF family hydrogenase formation chaperone [Candidatus Methylospira mobilis]|uniref:HypC/HybG/HupF family hydrogenase formation chaperone n=1 Tax=Candidatus Methylospira mobilis TaxID=1808979 RepID=A0A5Q0BLW3_9GAMM|nr:HypC/HybG/HupF family hydrogenase formation chaperone [Candidatus Methylospira mobilis]QFY44823.1 HypC/HybG/HupF family hydrogenase formation chaperone [Candidatus Methylospira mobilis]